MNPFEIIGGIILIVASIFIIAIVMLQESKQANGLDAVTGGSTNNYFDKSNAKTKDAIMGKITKVLAIIFLVAAFVFNLLIEFIK